MTYSRVATQSLCGCVWSLVSPIMQLWLDNEQVLQYKTGQTASELRFLWETVEGTLVKHYQQQHKQHGPPLSPFTSLLATLYWLRLYPPTRCIAAELEISESQVRECLNHTIASLFTCLVPTCFDHSKPPIAISHTGIMAGVCVAVDSTFLQLPHNSDKAERKLNYHFKSGTKQALKWQLCVTLDGVPWHLSHVVRGSTADVMLLRESGLLDLLALSTRMLGDKGYIGEAAVITPMKKPKGGELKDAEKKENKEKNSMRAVVENCIHQFKQWLILGGVYRGKWREDKHLSKATRIVHVIGAMVKRRLTIHPLRAHAVAPPS